MYPGQSLNFGSCASIGGRTRLLTGCGIWPRFEEVEEGSGGREKIRWTYLNENQMANLNEKCAKSGWV